MNPAARYAFFCAALPTDPTPDRPLLHSIVPPSFGGSPGARSNTVAVSPREALHAFGLLWKIAPTTSTKRAYAQYLRIALGRPEIVALGARRAWLLRAIAPFHRGTASPRTLARDVTLFHENGTSVTGDAPTLSEATGLDPRRVRDLISGRRPYAMGWATTPEAAAGNRRKRGRPSAWDFWADM